MIFAVERGAGGFVAKPKNLRDFAAVLESLSFNRKHAKALDDKPAQRYGWKQINQRLLDSYEEQILLKQGKNSKRLAA